MASLTFGLISDHPSRVDDDEEDVIVENRTYHVKIAETFRVLIICTCKLSKAFSEIYLLTRNAQKCGDIKEMIEGKEETTSKDIAEFFKIDDGIAVCHLKADSSPDFSNDLAEKILEVGQGEVIILHSEALVSYKTYQGIEDILSSTITKALKTSQWKDPVKLRELEQPNIVSGISAAILTACDFKKKPSLLLINFSESLIPDSVSLSGFSQLFQVASIRLFENLIPRRDAQEKLKLLAKNSPENLYL